MKLAIGHALGRTFGFACGLVLVIIGYALLTPDAGLSHGDRPMIAVLIALGIGVTAASLLPNSITLGGEKLKPLGLRLDATGGAAFFIVTLVFLFYSHQRIAAAESLPLDPPEAASVVAAAETPFEPIPTPAPAELLPVPVPVPASAAPGRDQAGAVTEFSVVTYCSACCPQGPDDCEQAGYGRAATLEAAFVQAVTMCIANGGREDTCIANAEQT